MKTRAGFVSNSSTTCFLIVGFPVDEEKVLELIKARETTKDECMDYDDLCESERIERIPELDGWFHRHWEDAWYFGKQLMHGENIDDAPASVLDVDIKEMKKKAAELGLEGEEIKAIIGGYYPC
jgi:hypothetical protein